MQEREHKIVNTLETYFSDASLLWDKVMVNKVINSPDGMVPIDDICKLQKMKTIQVTSQELASAVILSTRLKISEDNSRIGRIKPYVHNKKEELDDWSIYVEGFQRPYTDEPAIRELFNSLVGHVSFFRVPPSQQGHQHTISYCFLEFDNKNNVQKAVDLLNTYPKRKTPATAAQEENEKLKKLNLRVMSKVDWNKYKEQYLQLLAERKERVKELWEGYEEEVKETVEQEKEDGGEEGPGYVEGVIAFVENLHPSSAKSNALALLETSGISIAFISKKKGISTAYIRLNTKEDAQAISNYFKEHYILQETDKDKEGKKLDTASGCIKVRVITGSEEKIYWENDKKAKDLFGN